MIVKDNKVNIKDLKPEMTRVLTTIESAVKHIQGNDYIMVITSGKDGKHMVGSKHYIGEAIDIRTRDMIKNSITGTKTYIKTLLGSGYDVVEESDHIHIEYDPK